MSGCSNYPIWDEIQAGTNALSKFAPRGFGARDLGWLLEADPTKLYQSALEARNIATDAIDSFRYSFYHPYTPRK
jgi:hypothetical protein